MCCGIIFRYTVKTCHSDWSDKKPHGLIARQDFHSQRSLGDKRRERKGEAEGEGEEEEEERKREEIR